MSFIINYGLSKFYALQVWIHLYLPLLWGTFPDELSKRVPLMRRWVPSQSRSSHKRQALRVRRMIAGVHPDQVNFNSSYLINIFYLLNYASFNYAF